MSKDPRVVLINKVQETTEGLASALKQLLELGVSASKLSQEVAFSPKQINDLVATLDDDEDHDDSEDPQAPMTTESTDQQ